MLHVSGLPVAMLRGPALVARSQAQRARNKIVYSFRHRWTHMSRLIKNLTPTTCHNVQHRCSNALSPLSTPAKAHIVARRSHRGGKDMSRLPHAVLGAMSPARCVLFLSLSSGYSCNICSWTNTRPHYPRTPHTQHAYTTRSTTTHRLEDRVLLEITGTIYGSVDDRHVVIPLWLHAIEAVDYFWE
jgi:hypothetical protein